ncbi:hypothetical protein OEZ85_002341 [Tetradesmus obliquus]|uniref:Uncharacterized protein n=1 Tax=Tetradesmus obliquus TaxID=3088 RepID=A0ABY8U6V8_TETOB|nr:hypothetical protein OEZ85_002341 [Tetradesmus obliquus]
MAAKAAPIAIKFVSNKPSKKVAELLESLPSYDKQREKEQFAAGPTGHDRGGRRKIIIALKKPGSALLSQERLPYNMLSLMWQGPDETFMVPEKQQLQLMATFTKSTTMLDDNQAILQNIEGVKNVVIMRNNYAIIEVETTDHLWLLNCSYRIYKDALGGELGFSLCTPPPVSDMAAPHHTLHMFLSASLLLQDKGWLEQRYVLEVAAGESRIPAFCAGSKPNRFSNLITLVFVDLADVDRIEEEGHHSEDGEVLLRLATAEEVEQAQSGKRNIALSRFAAIFEIPHHLSPELAMQAVIQGVGFPLQLENIFRISAGPRGVAFRIAAPDEDRYFNLLGTKIKVTTPTVTTAVTFMGSDRSLVGATSTKDKDVVEHARQAYAAGKKYTEMFPEFELPKGFRGASDKTAGGNADGGKAAGSKADEPGDRLNAGAVKQLFNLFAAAAEQADPKRHCVRTG